VTSRVANEALARLGRLGPAVHAAVLDRHKRFVADHPRVVPRRNFKRLAGAKDPPRAGVGFDFYFAFEDNALVMVLAAGRPGHRFHVLGPAPPRLVDEAGDMRLAEKHDLHGHERKRDELIGLVESLRLEPRHVFRLRLGDSVPLSTSRGHRNEHPPSRDQHLAVAKLDGHRVARRERAQARPQEGSPQRGSFAWPLVIQASHGQVDGSSGHATRLIGSHEDRHVRHLLERHEPSRMGLACEELLPLFPGHS
jgi:hypothetical protein